MYTFEYRILASVWWHESGKSKVDMADIRNKLAERFDAPSPRGRTVKQWAEKLFSTGSLLDLPRTGRPSLEEEIVPALSAAITHQPNSSVRTLASDLGISTFTVRKYLHSEGYKPFWPTFT